MSDDTDPLLAQAVYPDPDAETIEVFRSLHCEKYAYYLISTSLAGQKNTQLWHGIRAVLPKHSRVRIVYFEKAMTLAPNRIFLARLKDGGYRYSAVHRLNQLEGEHLEVCIPLLKKGTTKRDPVDKKFERCRDIVERLIAVLSLTYGRHCAMDIRAEYMRDVDRRVVRVVSNRLIDAKTLLADSGKSRDLHDLLPDEIAYQVPKSVLRLIGSAECSEAPEVRFSLFWTALEVALGDGRQRKQFFCEEIGSQSMNDIFFQIFKVRGDWIHEGRKPSDPYSLEFMIKAAILLRFVNDKDIRSRIVSLLEKLILNEEWRSSKTSWIQADAIVDYSPTK